MKLKLFSFVSIFAITTSMIFSNVSAEQKISVFLNGKEVVSEQEPVIIDGSTYVPMRSIFEAFGFEIEWNPDKKRIKAKKIDDNCIIILQTGSTMINECGVNKTIEKAPVIVNNRVLLPLRAIGEELNSNVDWNSAKKRVSITKSNPSIITQASRNFNYQNYADKQFWCDDTWEENDDDYFDSSYWDDIFDEDDLDKCDFYDCDLSDCDENYDNKINNNKYQISKPVINSNPSDLTYEKQVLELVNAERAKQNLSPLVWNDDLANLARAHSEDMIARNFFDHINPDGQDPFARMNIYGIDYSYAAENIACGQQTPQAVMNSWMNSQGHRENILNPNLTELGVGLAKGGQYGFYWTQCFRTK